MNHDTIVEEIHDIRKQLLKEGGGNLSQFMARHKSELATQEGLKERAQRKLLRHG